MRRIVFASHKGGAGKSTSATALSLGLSARNKKVLLIDCDGQSNATWTVMGGAGVSPPTLSAVLMRQASADAAIRPTPIPNLDILPADPSLNGVNVALVTELGRDTRLRSAMAPLDGRWDFVVIDTAPSVTTILANALVYAEEVIVPVDVGIYGVLGLVQLMETIEEVAEAYGSSIHLAGLLLTKVSRNNVSRDIEAELRTRFDGRVFDAVVPLSTKVEEAHTRGLTVIQHAPKSPAAVAYGQLVEEVLNHGRAKNRRGDAPVGGPGAIDAA
jgi:chromosome partitioning protein